VIPATQEVEIGGSRSEASLSKSMRLCLKNKLKQKGLGAAYMIECLPNKHKALGSNPISTKKRKKRKKTL
jgi:hypothetical protein